MDFEKTALDIIDEIHADWTFDGRMSDSEADAARAEVKSLILSSLRAAYAAGREDAAKTAEAWRDDSGPDSARIVAFVVKCIAGAIRNGP